MRTCIINTSLFLFLVCNLSCKKNKEYVSGGNILSKIVQTFKYNGETTTSTLAYNYNSNKQLISITYNNNITNLFEYNGSGQLISATNFISPQSPFDIAMFVHDAQGKIAQKIDSPIVVNGGPDSHHYTYDLNNNIIVDSMPDLVIPQTIGAFNVYEYDAKGNVVKVSSYEYSTGSPILTYTTEHTYSDIPNPDYYNRAALYFGTGSNVGYLNKNLEADPTASYSFYTNGFVREVVYHSANGTSVFDYFYE